MYLRKIMEFKKKKKQFISKQRYYTNITII